MFIYIYIYIQNLVHWGEAAKEELKNKQNYKVIVNHKLFLEDSYASRAQLPPGLTDVKVIAGKK